MSGGAGAMLDGEERDGGLFGPGQPCFGCGPDHPHGLRLRFSRSGDEIVTRFTPDEQHQGPPGLMHGGLVMTLADELAVWVLIGLQGKFAFTSSFEGRLARPVRIGQPLEARGRLLKPGRRVVDVGVTLRQEGQECYSGTFRLVLLDESGARRLLGDAFEEKWLPFCR